MKKCVACGATFEVGKFCGRCGSPMEEVQLEIQPKQEPVMRSEPKTESKSNLEAQPQQQQQQQQQPEPEPELEPELKKTPKLETDQKKNKIKKEKKRFRKIKITILVFVIFFISILASGTYYLNQSQVSFSASSRFDDEKFKEELTKESFDGEVFNLELSENGVNFYIQEKLDEIELESLSLGTEVTDIFYKEGKVYIQLDGPFMHTTLVKTVSVSASERKILIEADKVHLGKWSIPVPKGFLNEAVVFPIEIELPLYLTVNDLQVGDEIKSEIALDPIYFDGFVYEAFESIDLDLLEYIKDEQSSYQKIYALHELILSGDAEALKTFRYDMISDKDTLVDFMAIMQRDVVIKLLDQIRVDSIHLEEDAYDDLMLLRDEEATELARVVDDYLVDRVTRAGGSFIEGFYSYLSTNNLSMNYISYEGKPYVPSLSRFVDATDLMGIVGDTVPSSFKYELFYSNDYLVVGVQTEDLYYLVDEWGSVNITTQEEAHTQLDYKPTSSLAQSKLLERGNQDRAKIAEVVSEYVGSDNSMYIRYLKSDSDWAIFIGSPGDYPQSISQVVLNKINGAWTVVAHYDQYYSLTYSIGTDLVANGFNVSLLPPFEVADYYTWYLYDSDISEIKTHLVDLGLVNSADEVGYLSRVDDVLAIIVGEKKFIFLFDNDSETTYNELIEIEPNETFNNYLSKLDSEYMGAKPTFVFIQD